MFTGHHSHNADGGEKHSYVSLDIAAGATKIETTVHYFYTCEQNRKNSGKHHFGVAIKTMHKDTIGLC